MRIRTRQVITQLAATLAWLLVCVTALLLWIGISTHARAQSPRASVSQNIMQNSRGPAAFPLEPAARQMLATGSAAHRGKNPPAGYLAGHSAPTHSTGEIICTSTLRLYI